MIHIHARTPDGVPSYEIEDFARHHRGDPRRGGRDVIVNYSTGAIGVPLEKRIAYLRALKPDIGALNMGSMNYAKYSRRRQDFVFKAVFENSFDTIIELCTAMRESGIKPEHECFDSGHIANLDPLLDMGLLEPPLQISCVMGVTGGIRPSARNLAHMAEQVPDGVAHEWGVIGISRAAVGAGRRGADARRQRARRAGGQLLPPGRRDGALQRRPRRAGAADVRGRRAAAGDGAREAARAPGPDVSGALEGIRVLDLSRLLPGGFCSRAAGRLRRRRAEGRGHRARRLRALGAAALRGRGAERRRRAVPGAQPQQALDPHRPQDRGGARGAAAARARVRRAARGLPPRRDGAPRRRLRAAARGEPAARLLRDHRLRAGRPVPRPLGPRHELPRPRRAARPDRRARTARRCSRRARSPTSAAAR